MMYMLNDKGSIDGMGMPPNGWMIVIAVLTICMAMMFAGCRTSKSGCDIPDTIIVIDTVNHYQTKHDSVWVHDSVYNEKIVAGDTVWLKYVKYQTKFVDRMLHDSIYINKCDTVVKHVAVEKQLTKWESFKVRNFWKVLVMLVILLSGVGLFVWKKVTK